MAGSIFAARSRPGLPDGALAGCGGQASRKMEAQPHSKLLPATASFRQAQQDTTRTSGPGPEATGTRFMAGDKTVRAPAHPAGAEHHERGRPGAALFLGPERPRPCSSPIRQAADDPRREPGPARAQTCSSPYSRCQPRRTPCRAGSERDDAGGRAAAASGGTACHRSGCVAVRAAARWCGSVTPSASSGIASRTPSVRCTAGGPRGPFRIPRLTCSEGFETAPRGGRPA